jgi:hypothetical protein
MYFVCMRCVLCGELRNCWISTFMIKWDKTISNLKHLFGSKNSQNTCNKIVCNLKVYFTKIHTLFGKKNILNDCGIFSFHSGQKWLTTFNGKAWLSWQRSAQQWTKLTHQPCSLILTDQEQSWKVKTFVLMTDSKRSKSWTLRLMNFRHHCIQQSMYVGCAAINHYE